MHFNPFQYPSIQNQFIPSSPPLKDLKIARNSGFFVFVLFFELIIELFVRFLEFLVMILSSKRSFDGDLYTSE